MPLTSGGALVIEQTEALVAIDVNSGRSRSAKDSETNAYETNKEAVDEICRQLRLRDLGGLIVNDLIDMRHQKHREEIERRIMRNFKRDRAKSTVLPISEFGIVEMTRQRMRPNTKKANFELCPTCEGTGEAPRPDSVAADALRRAAVVLEDESVRRIELVCSKVIATILSVDKKKEIERFEERSKRKIDIQVSDKIAEKRVDIYAYDETGADVEVSKTLNHKVPKITDLPLEVDPDDARDARKSGKRRRRRGRGKTAPADATAIALAGGFEIDEELEELENASADSESPDSDGKDNEQDGETRKKRKRRRRGRGKGRTAREARQREEDSKSIRVYALAKELETTSKEILERCREEGGFDELKNHMSSLEGEPLLKVRSWFTPEPQPSEEETTSDNSDSPTEDGESDDKPKRKRRRRRGRRGRRKDTDEESSSTEERSEEKEDDSDSEPTSEETPDSTEEHPEASDSDGDEDRPRKRRRRRRGRRRRKSESDQDGDVSPENEKSSGENSDSNSDSNSEDDEQRGGKRRGRRSGRDRDARSKPDSPAEKPVNQSSSSSEPTSTSPKSEDTPKAAPKRRSLYGGRIRRVGGMNLNPGK